MRGGMNLTEELRSRVLLFDGAMGTVLYNKGYFLNACYEQLVLSAPAVIESVHCDYLEAGADVITTDTFGANPLRLASFGLAEQTEAINAAAVRLARQAVEKKQVPAFVAGDVGPCSFFRQPNRTANRTAVREAFRRQMSALAEAGADFFLLETFTRPDELRLAAETAAEFGLPILASFTPPGNTVSSDEVDEEGVLHFVSLLNEMNSVSAIGLNCGSGPAAVFSAAETAVSHTHKPLVVMPNAGLPKMIDGRLMYLTNPEYFTEYAKRYIAIGVRGIGGCCGTTPEHIREAAAAVKPLAHARVSVEVVPASAAVVKEPVPEAERSHLAAKIASGQKVTSVEMVSPGGTDLSPMLEKVKICHEAGVDAVNIPDGPRANSRISPMIAALEIERRIGIETVLHYCCRDRNLIGIQADLLGAAVAGLRNLLLITGDPPKLGSYPQATGVFDIDSVGLTQLVSQLNRGYDPAGRAIEPPTAFYAGVGLNPCAVNLEAEKEHFIAKVKAGASFCVTQPVFDPESLLSMIRWMKDEGVFIPVIAGVWPLTSYKNAEFMKNEIPGVVLPDELLHRMAKAKTKEEGLKEGVAIAREMVAAVRSETAGIQVSAPFGRADIALEVLGDLL